MSLVHRASQRMKRDFVVKSWTFLMTTYGTVPTVSVKPPKHMALPEYPR